MPPRKPVKVLHVMGGFMTLHDHPAFIRNSNCSSCPYFPLPPLSSQSHQGDFLNCVPDHFDVLLVTSPGGSRCFLRCALTPQLSAWGSSSRGTPPSHHTPPIHSNWRKELPCFCIVWVHSSRLCSLHKEFPLPTSHPSNFYSAFSILWSVSTHEDFYVIIDHGMSPFLLFDCRLLAPYYCKLIGA